MFYLAIIVSIRARRSILDTLHHQEHFSAARDCAGQAFGVRCHYDTHLGMLDPRLSLELRSTDSRMLQNTCSPGAKHATINVFDGVKY